MENRSDLFFYRGNRTWPLLVHATMTPRTPTHRRRAF